MGNWKAPIAAALIVPLLAPGDASVAAQQTQTASISGVVVRAGTAEPIAGARVLASLNDQDGGRLLEAEADTDPLPFLQQVVSDANGRFLLTGLRPGMYTVTAQRSGYASQQYGARAPRRPGVRLAIVAGQPGHELVVPLMPTGAISGRVTGAAGEPIAKTAILIQRSAYAADGARTLKVAGTTHTDDRGEYRAYWIAPGRYYVLAAPFGSSLRELRVAGYPATYYPGVTEQSAATTVDVAPGSDVNAIDVSLSRQRLFRVRGRVPDTDDFTPDLVWLCSRHAADDAAGRQGILWNLFPFHPGRGEGQFEIREVPPGSYSIHASAGEVPLLTGTVEVSTADVDNVVLTSDRGSLIDVRVKWEGAALASASDREVPLILDPVTYCSGDERTPIRGPNGSRQFKQVVAGNYRLRAVLPAGSYLKSVRLNGVDAMNGFTVSSAIASSLDVVFSENAARIEGTVVDKAGRPMPGVEAVLLPLREADRTPGRVKAMVTDQYGRFDLPSIAPGDYRLFAWEDLEPYAYYDADFVRPYMTAGTLIRATENFRQSVQLVSIPPR